MRALVIVVLGVVAAIASGGALIATGQEPDRPAREAGLRFAADMPEKDRAWVRAAIASARPEAQRLIDEIDGLVEVSRQASLPDAIGMAHLSEDSALITLDTTLLNADRVLDRDVVVLHELGHVIDYMLVPDEVVLQLDAAIPRGTCQSTVDHIGACTAIEERFADTFAKWALRGKVSMAGSGYGIPTPSSLEDWGAPLGRLAAQLTVKARG